MEFRPDVDAASHRHAPRGPLDGSIGGADCEERRVEIEKNNDLKPSLVAMLGIVPMPSDADRCTAVSKRSGKRCKRYRQARSSVCSKHGSSVLRAERLGVDIDRFGSGKPIASRDVDTWAWTEDEWQARFDAVNDWISTELPETNPALSERLWQFVALVETELPADQIFELAGWFRSVLQGAAVIAVEEGLTLTA